MKNTLHKAARCLLFTILATVTPLARSVVYVDGAAAGLENGTSWANAYKDLRIAMAASPANAEIWVAAGVYKPGPSRADSFVLKPGMKLYGGFTSGMTARDQRDWTANPTTLSGDINTLNTHTDNSDHILIGAAGAMVDGFTVERGGDQHFNLAQDGVIGAFGAGLYVAEAGADAMRLANCTFRYNNAYYDDGTTRSNTGYGGAIFATNSALEIASCIFEGNSAQQKGGAIYLVNPDGAASYDVSISNCVFRSANATRMGSGQMGGGGIWASAGKLAVKDSQFIYCRGGINDMVYGNGGAIYLVPGGDGSDLATVEDSVFTYNQCGSGQGGAIYAGRDMLVEGCTFSQNRCHTRARGGAIFVAAGATADIRRCDFGANSAYQNAHFYTWGMDGNFEQGQGGAIAAEGTVSAKNCVFAGNYSGSEDSRELLSYTPFPAVTNYVDQGDGMIATNITPAYVVTNVVVAAGLKGGGAAFWQKPGSNGGSTLENCTFAGNRANKHGGAVFADNLTNDVELLNCIAWGDEAWRRFRDELDTTDELFGDSIVVRYTDIAGGWSGTGGNNLDVDPRFGIFGEADGEAFAGTWTAAPSYDAATGRTTFTDANAAWIPGALVGLFLEPTTNEWVVFAPKTWGAPDYTNSVCGLKFPIAANTATTVSVFGDPRNVDYYWRTTRTYAASGHFYRIHDYHLKAMGGRWTPLTAVTGRWTVDDVDSPCLHQGDPASDYSLEPYPNGSRIDMGAYGNTEQASKRVAASMMLLR